MADAAPYLDTALLAKLYLDEPGAIAVRRLAGPHPRVCCAEHGRVELAYVLHRKLREGELTRAQASALHELVEDDTRRGLLHWLPVDADVLESARQAAIGLPASVPLRSADAIHLACARQHGFVRVFSNDRHLLGAASAFGLEGVDPTRAEGE